MWGGGGRDNFRNFHTPVFFLLFFQLLLLCLCCCYCCFLDLGTEIFNAEVLFKEDCTSDEFVDVILGNRAYLPCLYVSISSEYVAATEHRRNNFLIIKFMSFKYFAQWWPPPCWEDSGGKSQQLIPPLHLFLFF